MKNLIILLLMSVNTILCNAQDKQVQIDSTLMKTAFGDTYFDMSWEAAIKSDIVNQKGNKFKKYKSEGVLLADNYPIGNDKYRIRLVFEGNILTEVNVSSYLLNASHYDEAIKTSFLNLKDVFSAKYGEPVYNFGFPSILNIKTRKTIWVYGDKVISLSVDKSEYLYYVAISISIINAETTQKFINKLQPQKENIQKSSNLF